MRNVRLHISHVLNAVTAADPEHPRNGAGAALLIVSAISLAGMMSCIKALGAEYTIWQLLFFRMGSQSLMFVPMMVRSRGELLHTKRLGMHGLRLALALGAISCWFYALTHLPMAEASALSFSKSLFITAFSIIILMERPSLLTLFSTVLGFVGVLVLLNPSTQTINPAALAGIGTAVFGAAITIVIKRLLQTEATSTLMAYPALALTVITAIPTYLYWQPLGLRELGLVIIMAASGFFAQWCFINAYRVGEASVLAPVEYSRLGAAVLFGLVFFAEVPGARTLAGISLIVIATGLAVRAGTGRGQRP